MPETIAKKSTDELMKELEGSEDFRRFVSDNARQFSDQTLSQALTQILEEKGLKKTEVFRRAEMSDDYGYQLFSGLRKPKRGKLLSLAVAMDLDLPQTQALLKLAGEAPLYVKNEFDCVVLYGIFHRMSVVEINEILYETLKRTLGEDK